MYHLEAKLVRGDKVLDSVSRRFGMREVEVKGSTIRLNGRPVYVRGVLHWGWSAKRICPSPTPDEIRDELRKIRSLGFNLVKHCLYVPTTDYLDIADELGLLLWLELPLWLPRMSPAFRKRVKWEYQQIIRQVRGHPSVICYTLGCELNQEVSAEFLRDMYKEVKELTGCPLVRDNSGSGECYGGQLVESADFYDHHFYSDPHLLSDLLDRFSPRWREIKPWLLGEFCDVDTFRDLRAIIQANDGEPPWWLQKDEDVNPVGVRWEYSVVDQLARLEKAGLAGRSDMVDPSVKTQSGVGISYSHLLPLWGGCSQ